MRKVYATVEATVLPVRVKVATRHEGDSGMVK
jgi:hypothetical protein